MMLVSDREVVEREAGITFSQLPLAMDKALGIIVRSELQALGIFRAIDADNDQVIMLSDAREMLTDPTDPETDADENAARMVAADLYLNKVCDVIDSRGASIRSLYSELERMAASTSPGGISKDDFIHFVRGWCPSDVARTIGHKQQESILRAVDCNADDTIGWEEFQEAFVSCYGRRLLKLRKECIRAKEARLPSMQQLYKDNVAEIGRVQQAMARAFRRQPQMKIVLPPKKSKQDRTKEEIATLQAYIAELSEMRQSRQAQLAAISKNVTYDDGSLAVTTVGSIQEGMRRVDEIADHAGLLGKADPSNLGSYSVFVTSISDDVRKLSLSILHVLQGLKEADSCMR
eukprot:g5108.t1